MAYNPYFRYESTFLNLGTGVRGPSFPVPSGLNLHSYVTEKYNYTTTSRMYGTTSFRYTISGIKKDDLDVIKDFWETTLDEGYNDFTIIDNKSRILFDASWKTWQKTWSKRRGGIYQVGIDIESPYPWTLPIIAAYPMQLNTATTLPTPIQTLNHQGSFFAFDHINSQTGSAMREKEANTLRNNGCALRMTGNGTTSQLTGATLQIDWKSNIKGSLSLFCQFRGTLTTTDRLLLVQIKNSDESKEYALWQDGSSLEFGGRINGNDVGVSSGTYHSISVGTWYDCAITYDAHNDNIYVYIQESATSSFTDFLSGLSDITDQIGSYMATPTTPPDNGYTTINLLRDDGAGGISNGQFAYIQNVFIFDGHLTPMHFNLMRRLCYLWNGKTEIYPK